LFLQELKEDQARFGLPVAWKVLILETPLESWFPNGVTSPPTPWESSAVVK